MYVRGATRAVDKSLATSIKSAQHRRAELTLKLAGITNEVQALRKARAIIVQAEKDATVIREQAYDFGLAQLDRDYPTRQDRNRERARAKNTLVKKYGNQRLKAATAEANQWDHKHQEAA